MKKIVVTVPVESADKVRQAIGEVGAGNIGNYIFCSFSSVGVGRFIPMIGAKPAKGEIGRPEEVKEERIEVTCDDLYVSVDEVVAAIRRVHPYEEPVIDIYLLM